VRATSSGRALPEKRPPALQAAAPQACCRLPRRAARTVTAPLPPLFAGGPIVLAKPKPPAQPAPARQDAAAGAQAQGVARAACSGGLQAESARVTVTAGTAATVTKKGKIKTKGAPLGVWLDILPAGAAANATVDPACRIKLGGAIKAGKTRARTVAAKKLTACYTALELQPANCSKPLQARATAVAGNKYKEGTASKVAAFTPKCAPC
jgi:hypothetical protein